MYQVSVTFTGNQVVKVVDVAEVHITNNDYVVKGTNGGSTHFPKANVYSFSYLKAD